MGEAKCDKEAPSIKSSVTDTCSTDNAHIRLAIQESLKSMQLEKLARPNKLSSSRAAKPPYVQRHSAPAVVSRPSKPPSKVQKRSSVQSIRTERSIKSSSCSSTGKSVKSGKAKNPF